MKIQRHLRMALESGKNFKGFVVVTKSIRTQRQLILAAEASGCLYSILKFGRSGMMAVSGTMGQLREFYEHMKRFDELKENDPGD